MFTYTGTQSVSLDEIFQVLFSIYETSPVESTPRKKLGEDVRLASQNPLPVYDQILRFSLPCPIYDLTKH